MNRFLKWLDRILPPRRALPPTAENARREYLTTIEQLREAAKDTGRRLSWDEAEKELRAIDTLLHVGAITEREAGLARFRVKYDLYRGMTGRAPWVQMVGRATRPALHKPADFLRIV